MEENAMNGKPLWNATGGKTVQERTPAGRSRAVQRARMTAWAIVGAVLLIGAMVAPLCAQSYPNKPVRFILPMGPGGATDLVGRIIAAKLAEQLGQPVVPDNRVGGATHFGTEFVAKARPDGYTILLNAAEITTGPSLFKKLGYDPIKDLAPISMVAQIPLMLVVRPDFPAKTLKELVEYARANPGKLTNGSGGVGSAPHLAGELLNTLAKIKIMHVPFKAAGPTLVGMMGGEVDMTMLSFAASLPLVQAGKARALAVLSNTRAMALPDVPTAKEAGIDNWEVLLWFGILAPAGTPRDIINRLNAEWIKIAAMPDTIDKMRKAGFEPLSSTPEKVSEFMKAEIVRWGKVIKDANIPPLD